MKNKKIFLILPLLMLTSCDNKNVLLYLGENLYFQNVDFKVSLNEHYSLEVNDDFSSSKFYMKEFYSLLEKDALNLQTSNRISDCLNKSKTIIFNVGNYELLRFINYSENSFTYEKEVIRTSLEMFEYYFYHSLEILSTYNSNIVIIPLFKSILLNDDYQNEYSTLINQYNSVIYQTCNEFQIKYLEINQMHKFVYQNNKLTEPGFNYLIKKIDEKL